MTTSISDNRVNMKSLFLPRIVRWLAFTAVLVVLLFGLAGRWDLPMLWAYAGVYSALMLVGVFFIDPELGKERWRPGPGGTDRITRVVVGPVFMVHLGIGALDVGRFHWSDTIPLSVRFPSLVLCAASFGVVIWSMAVNRFFSSVVRIQQERGHHIVTHGPYGYVRHPGYIGMSIGALSSPLALGSWWSMVPATIYAFLILRRTALEDRYLKEHLEGYASYVEKVRYRLVPGLW